MSKKLFAALSLSVLLAACQGNVTTDTSMDADEAMMEDTPDTMMDDTTSGAMMEDESMMDGTVEVEMEADAMVQ